MTDQIVMSGIVLVGVVGYGIYAWLVAALDRCYLKEISDSLHSDPLRRAFDVNVNLENDTFLVAYNECREDHLQLLEIAHKVDGSKICLEFRGLRNNLVVTLRRASDERTLSHRDDQRRAKCILRKVHGALGVVSRRSYAS